MKQQLVGLLLLSIILPISIVGCHSSRSKQPQTIATANSPQVKIVENYQSSFVLRMQKREQARHQAIADLQSGAKIERSSYEESS